MLARPNLGRGAKGNRMKVGVIMPLGESQAIGRPPSYAELRELALQAEESGFDSVWVYDHLIYRFPERPQFGIWECWSILAGLAEATKRVELGTLVMCALWRNPALLAKMAVTTDEVSGGRLILGLGAGWHEPEFTAFGYPFDHLGGRFAEALQIIAPLLKEGKVDFHGKYFSAPECELTPRGPRPGGPPVLVASKGQQMMRLTARYADKWNTAWYGRASAIATRRAEMEEACRDVGRDPQSLEITVGVNVTFEEPSGTPTTPVDPDRMLTGTADDIAAALGDYAAAGVGHVIIGLPLTQAPRDTAKGIDVLAKALHTFKQG